MCRTYAYTHTYTHKHTHTHLQMCRRSSNTHIHTYRFVVYWATHIHTFTLADVREIEQGMQAEAKRACAACEVINATGGCLLKFVNNIMLCSLLQSLIIAEETEQHTSPLVFGLLSFSVLSPILAPRSKYLAEFPKNIQHGGVSRVKKILLALSALSFIW